MNLQKGERILHYASYAFDASVHEILNAFWTGGCLCIPSDEERNQLEDYISSNHVSWAVLTPVSISALDPHNVPSLKTLVSTGEVLPEGVMSRWPASMTLLNAFGPTEAGFCCTVQRLAPGRERGAVGYVVNGRGWIVDNEDISLLCPTGASGELLLEGPALAAGYLHEPLLTRQAFVQAPPWRKRFPGECQRLYRTGDIVKYDQAGGLIFLGRKDRLVKVNGQRIELDEVQHCIDRFTNMEFDAVVVAAVPRDLEQTVLVVYVAHKPSSPERTVDVQRLHEHMMGALPSAMVPAFYVRLEAMPRLLSGKVDQRQLHALNSAMTLEQLMQSRPDRAEIVEPTTDLERHLQALWASALGTQPHQLGIHDNFFKIGGDSVAVMRLIAAAKRAGTTVTAAFVFRHPTLALQAVQLDLAANHEDQDKDVSASLTQLDFLKPKAASICGVDVTEIDDILPCTPLQEGLMAVSQRNLDTYVSRTVLQLRDTVDLDAFRIALQRLLSTSQMCRTRIVDILSAGLVQVVLRTPPNVETANNLAEYLHRDQQDHMRLGSRLMRFALIIDGSKSAPSLVWTKHHAVFDGWSIDILLMSLVRLYHNHTIDINRNFRLFVQYSRKIVESESTTKYWQSFLASPQPAIWPRLPFHDYKPDANAVIKHDIVASISDSKMVTFSTIVRAALALTLAHFTYSVDTIFGATVSGRTAPIASIVDVDGPTIATVPVRIALDWDMDVNTFLHRVQEQSTDMIPYEQTGLQNIARMVGSTAANIAFQCLLVIQPIDDPSKHGDLFVPSVDNTYGDVMDLNAFNSYATMIQCHLGRDKHTLELSFDSYVISHAKAAQLLETLAMNIAYLAADDSGTRLLWELQPIIPDHMSRILEWNCKLPVAIDACVQDIISKQVARRPGAAAVCAWDATFTYSELWDLSSQLARYLVSKGLGNGSIIPLFFEKSAWATVALISVMRIGAISVSVDVSQPIARLQLLMEQVKPSLAICSRHYTKLCTSAGVSDTVELDSTWFEHSPLKSSDAQLPKTRSSDTLYIAFTSGSTGLPKGVMIAHQNIVSAVHHQPKIFGLDDMARIYDFSSYSFDVALLNCFFCLSLGGCLCIPSETDRKNNITASMKRLAVTTACLTPSTARIIDSSPEAIPTFKTLSLAGEAVKQRDLDKWADRLKLINVYGPTETISSTIQPIESSQDDPSNIGRGVGLLTWVVNLSDRGLAPVGSVGELWLEGPLVGQGYFRDPVKTRASFIDAPPWLQSIIKRPMSRIYKTGDLVRYDEERGTLFYMCRKDDQVKIRGQRVELEEVEKCARKYLVGRGASVVAAVAKPKSAENQMLVMFIQLTEPHSSQPPEQTLAELTDLLDTAMQKDLPSYMVPSFYLSISDVPLTFSGKIDRPRLVQKVTLSTMEELADSQCRRDRAKVAPRTAMEVRLLRAWTLVLDLAQESVSIEDNFFRLGGDSVQAMRLVARAREEGLELTVNDVFKNPVLKDLAKLAVPYTQSTVEVAAFALLPPGTSRSDLIRQAAQQCDITDLDMIEDIFPATELQKGLLSATMKNPAANVDKTVYEVLDYIDIYQLQAAFNQAARSEAVIMRMLMVDLPDVGVSQVIVRHDLPWVMLDGTVTEYLKQESKKQLGLGTTLNKFALVRDVTTQPCRRFLVWTKHHATYDGWSVALILQRVQELYFSRPPSKILTPYSRFMKQLSTIDESDADQYWRNSLRELSAPVFPPLPSSHFQPLSQTVLKYETRPIAWPHSDITVSTLIKTAWALAIAQYTNSEDVLFGAVSFGRSSPLLDAESVVGPTIATLPIRAIIDWTQPIIKLLKIMQDEALNMLAYEQTGINKALAERSESRQHLLQTVLVVQTIESSTSDSASDIFTAESLQGTTRDASEMHDFNPYALMIECRILPSGQHSYTLSFDNRVMSETEYHRMLRHVEHLLHRICHNTSASLGSLRQASNDDLKEILAWNPPSLPPCQSTVRDLIVDQIARSANEVALHAWDGIMSYSELDAASDRVAAQLLSMNSTQNIPLCFEKSLWMAVAMLACIKIGLTAVALDVNHPEERLRLIMEQVGANHVLCSEHCQPLVDRIGIGSKTVVSSTRLQTMPSAMQVPLPHIEIESPLFIVFTSGSTGTPKGVVITNSNFSSAATYQRETLGFTSAARVYDFASYSFDAAWSNIIHALTTGGCLCVPSEDMRKDDIATSMRELGVTYADLTPSAMRLVEPADVPSLNTLVLAGEPLSQKDIATWAPRVTLRNTYGPAECSVTATASPILVASTPSNNIGRGVACNTWIVDPEYGTSLVPIGAIGELWIEGPIVGLGYYNDPEKTKLSFIENPLWLPKKYHTVNGHLGRFYRTGDLVKYGSDGDLAFIGRKDNQTKVRGQRLELGEVEQHVLDKFPGLVDAAAVVVRKDNQASQSKLVAFLWLDLRSHHNLVIDEDSDIFYVVDNALSALISNAKSEIAKIAPRYAVPDVFCPVRYLPRMPSGKLNRKLLENLGVTAFDRQITSLDSTPGEKKRQPATKIEKLLRSVISQILNLKETEIGCDESFFSLGGDSISAMRMSAKCKAQDFRISVSQIFENETIERMASVKQQSPILQLEENAAPLDLREDGEFSLSPIQSWFFETQHKDHNLFYQHVLVKITRSEAVKGLRSGLESVVAMHPMLRARFKQSQTGEWVQWLSKSENGSWLYQETKAQDLEPGGKSFFATAARSLDIENGPVFVANLITTIEGTHYLMLLAHHLVIDLVSWRIVLEDLESIMEPLDGGIHEPEATSFRTWCSEQKQHATRELSPDVVLPSAYPVVDNSYWEVAADENIYEATRHSGFVLSEAITKALSSNANSAFGTRTSELLQAALAYSFHIVFYDRDAPVLFNEGHGRERFNSRVDPSRTVGWLTTMWPLYIPITDRYNIEDVIMRTKDSCRSIPLNGWAYFASRYLHPRGRQAFDTNGPVELLFNYEGHYQQFEHINALFQQVPEPEEDLAEGLLRRFRRAAIIEATASIRDGQLQAVLTLPKQAKHQSKFDLWTAKWRETLEAIAERLPQMSTQLTLVDLPTVPSGSLSYGSLDKLLAWMNSNNIDKNSLAFLYPCSSTASAMLNAHERATKLYATHAIYRLQSKHSGKMDVNRLAECWNSLVNSQPALRTVAWKGGDETSEWYAAVLNDVSMTCAVERATSESEVIKKLEMLPAIDYTRHLASHQLTIISCDDDATLIRFDACHALMDGTSRSILFDEWSRLYDTGGNPINKPRELAPDSCSGLIVERWSRRVSSTLYWNKYLRGQPPCRFGLTTSERTATTRCQALIRCDALSDRTTAWQRAGFSTATLMKAVWAVVLDIFTKHSGDICFAYFDGGRQEGPVSEAESSLGLLSNIMLCRAKIDQATQRRTLMQAIQSDYSRSLPHAAWALAGSSNGGRMKPNNIVTSLLNHRKDISDSDTAETSSSHVERAITWELISYDDVMEVKRIQLSHFLTSSNELIVRLLHQHRRRSQQLSHNARLS
jgi:amino acid adenylation domain-containing protein/non-ribosomal peptide synthase protein (TIGR01720 family)